MVSTALHMDMLIAIYAVYAARRNVGIWLVAAKVCLNCSRKRGG